MHDDVSSIAVIGSVAGNYLDGGATVATPTGLITILDGITARAGSGTTVEYGPGTDYVGLGDILPGAAAAALRRAPTCS